MSEVTVLEGYRVTIPEKVRTRLRIRKGDRLSCELRGGEIILKAEHIPKNPTLKMLGLAAAVKMSLEQGVIEEVNEKLARRPKVSRR